MVPHLRTHGYQRAGLRGGCLPALILGLAAVAVHLCLRPQNFVSGSLACRRSTPRVASAAGSRRGRTGLASRGGESAETFEVGDKVLAISSADEQRYPGTIDSANTDGTFTVRWDDSEGGPETEDVGPDNMKKVVIFKDYVVGDDVQAVSPDDNQWYPGTVTQAEGDGTFTVKWDDPDGGPETSTVKPEGMKKVTIFKDYKVDDVVDALYPGEGGTYAATVVKVNDDGTFLVKWEDADGGPEESVLGYKDMKFPRIAVEKLEVGQKHLGQVRYITDFGAFVDIGAECDGLLHISRISREHVESAHDFLEEGQEVEVWISGKRDGGKFSLTMVEGLVEGARRGPVDVKLPPIAVEKLEVGQKYIGRVRTVTGFGAFIDIGAKRDGLLHISRMRAWNPHDVLEEGQEVEVWISSKTDDGRFGLTIVEGLGEEGEKSPVDMKLPSIAVEKLEVGQKYIGQVRTVTGFGAFIDIGAQRDGLLHISRIKRERVWNPHDVLEEGQEVEVWISSKTDDGKFGLTMVEGLVEGAEKSPVDLGPFADMAPDMWLRGRVAATRPWGAFVTVTIPGGGPTAFGLVHMSEMKDDGFVHSVEEEVQVGDKVQVRIKSVDLEAGKITLTMRGGGGETRGPAGLSAFESISSDTWLTGKVATTASFGAFVTVTAEDGSTADGLLHITQIKDGFVESVEAELSEGQEVQVRVLSVDVGAGKMGLSMKPPEF